MSIHSIKKHQCHLAWDNSIPPVLRVSSGETIHFDCLDASNGQLDANSTTTTLASMVFSQLDQVNGPIYVEGAKSGDVLQVEVIDVKAADWGWTAILPGFGLLADEYTTAELKIWKLEKDDFGARFAWFDEAKGIKIPLNPFAGEMGVAPGKNGSFSTIPPYNTGGNLDTRHLTKGATLYLPVEVEGALFSIGDGHAAQGDGEVGGTAIETPMKVTVRLTVIKDRPYVKTPHFTTSITGQDYYTTTGIESDIREAARAAVRHMIEFLAAEYGVTPEQAYMLCSVAGDLRLHEVVDMPNYVVR
ncbi:Formamidase [Punctularia strigosozonata HHB-11173 SS5]|uniref:Formamidase n=1 Tax=Punctularia strigosozonata (strain HHB-11173) TaxID=741275 RepID=UPI00044170C8|nr:Formamidase [Punctularia strigosozonata HHB-11173 SS5]EIN06506.1 Formamidase [Punctularia strigosozonata HHB-11173 SS5]